MSEFFYNSDSDSDNTYDYSNFVEYFEPNKQNKEMSLFNMREFDLGLYNIYDSFFLNEIRALPRDGVYVIGSDEYRIDLISFNIYNSVDYWWLLLEFNDIINEEELKTGTNIYYFSLDSLEKLIHTCIVKENIKKTNDKTY